MNANFLTDLKGLSELPLVQCNPADGPRFYFNECNSHLKYSSVTSILSATQSSSSKFALKAWKDKILADGEDPDEIRDDAARRGSQIHDWLELFLQAKDPAIPEEIASYCGHLVSCGLWKHLDQVVCTEHKVCSDQGLVPFAGTLDALLVINGKLCLFDLKTKAAGKGKPSKAVINEAMCQLQAYRLGLAENYGMEITRFMALYAFPDRPPCIVTASDKELEQHEVHWAKRVKAYSLASF